MALIPAINGPNHTQGYLDQYIDDGFEQMQYNDNVKTTKTMGRTARAIGRSKFSNR